MVKIGMFIGDRYEILEKIGTGGMSDVYKAKCHKLNRFVAVKVLKQEFSENVTFVSKFRVEAQAAAGLMHPNIVNVYDVGEENGIYYIVMELVEGITLKEYIAKKARLSVDEAVSIAIQVSSGLETAHRNHIIHRDIKPQNIIISREGKVKVTDFGIAKAATSNTITSNVMGSVHYTSPEQARGGYSDERSDIYSLGITLFEMLTGKIPFNGDTTVAIAIKHIQEKFPSPRDYVHEIPVSVEKIVLKCCQKSPDRRYQSMGELITDLKRSLTNPKEDFVVMVNPDEEASTRMISDQERKEIRRQSAVVEEAEMLKLKNEMRRETEKEEELRRKRQEPDKRRSEDKPRQTREKDSPKSSGKAESGKNRKSNKKSGKRADRRDWDEEERKSRKSKATNVYEEEYDDYSVEMEDYPEVYSDEDEDYNPRMEKVTTILAVVAAVLIGCILLFLAGRAFGLFDFGGQGGREGEGGAQQEQAAEPVKMIKVEGMKAEEAKEALLKLGLTPEIEYEETADAEEGVVLRASVGEGTLVDGGSNVILTISAGSKGVEVPEVTGLTKAEAVANLEKKSFVVNKAESYDSTVPKDSVISQSPEGGSKAPSGSTVTIRVSLGAEETKIQVPNVVGMTEMDAVATLTEAGLAPGSISEVTNEDPALTDLICYQSYSVGTYVEKDTVVDLKVSVGPQQATYSYVGNIEAPTLEEDGAYKGGINVTVTVVADDGTQLLSTQTTSFPLPVKFTGIKAAAGTVTLQYVVTADAATTTDPNTGEVITTEGTPEEKTVTRVVQFAPEQ